jgi:hypothetical protein
MNARAYAGGTWDDTKRNAESYWKDTKGGCLIFGGPAWAARAELGLMKQPGCRGYGCAVYAARLSHCWAAAAATDHCAHGLHAVPSALHVLDSHTCFDPDAAVLLQARARRATTSLWIRPGATGTAPATRQVTSLLVRCVYLSDPYSSRSISCICLVVGMPLSGLGCPGSITGSQSCACSR